MLVLVLSILVLLIIAVSSFVDYVLVMPLAVLEMLLASLSALLGSALWRGRIVVAKLLDVDVTVLGILVCWRNSFLVNWRSLVVSERISFFEVDSCEERWMTLASCPNPRNTRVTYPCHAS